MPILRNPKEKTLPKQCDICKDAINLYSPWYSILAKSHFTGSKLVNEEWALCPDCFKAYEHFLKEQEFRQIHKREIGESMHPED